MDIKKGSSWKRISAFLFDLILFAITALIAATLISWILKYDANLASYQERKTAVETAYGITFDISEEEYLSYDAEKKAAYDAAYEALNADSEAVRLYMLLNSQALLIVSFSLLFAFLVLEFAVPMLFKNGVTLGKKIFGLCVVKQSGVAVTGPVMFVRTILGKYAVETQIPAYILIMFFFGRADLFLLILLGAILLVNVGLFLFTQNHLTLHDLIAVTAVADYATQKIFPSEEEKAAYLAKEEEDRIRKMREENVFSKP
ncbi:MAG: RDD family protein [Lachnospiraceae bacterium]|nr:RDD family protein [Lachnospiraceae bacterium]